MNGVTLMIEHFLPIGIIDGNLRKCLEGEDDEECYEKESFHQLDEIAL